MKTEQFGEITTILGDCMDYMKTLPDNHFDLAICDPPYGINASSESFMKKGKQTGKSKCVSGINYKSGNWDLSIPERDYFIQLNRISKNQIIWGGNYFIDYLTNTSCMIVWDKDNGANLYADCEIAWTSFKSAIRKYKYKWHGMLQENMKNKEIRQHPTQKPVALYKWLLHNYAKEGDSILDTHGSSMSSAIACHDMGFKMTIIEKDEDYYNEATKRLRHHQQQQTLF